MHNNLTKIFHKVTPVGYFVLIILSINPLNSCNHSDKTGKDLANDRGLEVIDLTSIKPTNEQILLSEIAENIEYVPLEYKAESMLGERGVSNVRLHGKYIFIGYIASVKQFDSTGKYIRDLYRVGRGPGETFKRDFVIDTDSSRVLVYSNYTNAIQKYNFQGDFIGKLNKSVINGSEENMFYFKRKLILNYDYWNQPQNHFIVIDLDSNEIDFVYKNYYHYIKPETKGYGVDMQFRYTSFQEFNNHFLFKELCCDTLFQTKDFVTTEPRYIFNIGNKKVTYAEYSDWTYGIKSPENGQVLIADFFETNPLIVLLLGKYSNNISNWIIASYNKSSRETVLTSNTIMRNDFDNGPDIDLKMGFNASRVLTLNNKNYLCYLIWPLDFLKLLDSGKLTEKTSQYPEKTKELISLIKKLHVDDNPVLMKITLK
jgi:hypothetical protein